MFDNIGKKIMGLASVLTALGIIGSIFIGLRTAVYNDDLIVPGILIMIFGSLASWIGSFMIYGFGRLIDNSDEMVRLLRARSGSTSGSSPSYNNGAPGYDGDDDGDGDEYNGAPPRPSTYVPPINVSYVQHWRCSGCGKTISSDICPFCGRSSITATVETPSHKNGHTPDPRSESESGAQKSSGNGAAEGDLLFADDSEIMDDMSAFIENNNIKICRKCGSILEPSNLFCTFCGEKL